MAIELPNLIAEYFESDRRRNTDAASRLFAATAVVKDESRTYRGRNQIREWMANASTQYTDTVEPFSIGRDGKRTVVTSHLRSNLDGQSDTPAGQETGDIHSPVANGRSALSKDLAMEMPDSVKAYFEAEQRADPDVLVAAFSPNAIVRDEGGRHEGLAAICDWWTAAKKRYRHAAMPIEMTGKGDTISICAVVTGKFPNSPVTLTFSFKLRDRKIAELEIA